MVSRCFRPADAARELQKDGRPFDLRRQLGLGWEAFYKY